MYINCEVYESVSGERITTPKGFTYGKLKKERKTIDTDLLDFFTGVHFSSGKYEYPYPETCQVEFKDRTKYPLVISKDTLKKIQSKLEKNVIRI